MNEGDVMRELTGRQKEIFDYIVSYSRSEGNIPTVREIGEAFGFASTNAVTTHLKALVKKGYINLKPGMARNIEIAPDFLIPERGVPLVGRVAAGTPIDAIENLDGYLDLDAFYEPGQHFALKIVGDSMIEAGFWDGDYAIIRKQSQVETNEIGVAVIDGQATVKRFRWLADGSLLLVPENEKYEPFVVRPEFDFHIAGKAVGMMRVLR